MKDREEGILVENLIDVLKENKDNLYLKFYCSEQDSVTEIEFEENNVFDVDYEILDELIENPVTCMERMNLPFFKIFTKEYKKPIYNQPSSYINMIKMFIKEDDELVPILIKKIDFETITENKRIGIIYKLFI